MTRQSQKNRLANLLGSSSSSIPVNLGVNTGPSIKLLPMRQCFDLDHTNIFTRHAIAPQSSPRIARTMKCQSAKTQKTKYPQAFLLSSFTGSLLLSVPVLSRPGNLTANALSLLS